jgi:hypothetical protein
LGVEVEVMAVWLANGSGRKRGGGDLQRPVDRDTGAAATPASTTVTVTAAANVSAAFAAFLTVIPLSASPAGLDTKMRLACCGESGPLASETNP